MKKIIYFIPLFLYLAISLFVTGCKDDPVTPGSTDQLLYEKDSLIIYDNLSLDTTLYMEFNFESINSFKMNYEIISTITDTFCLRGIRMTTKNIYGTGNWDSIIRQPENQHWEITKNLLDPTVSMELSLTIFRYGGNPDPSKYLKIKNFKFYKTS